MYIDSSYLKNAIMTTPSFASMEMWQNPNDLIGTLYTFASIVTLFALLIAPRILRRFGNYRWTLGTLLLLAMTLLGLAIFNTAWLIIPLFILEAAITSILYFNFDLFLEHYSKDTETGIIRGIFKALTSIAWLVPPFLAGVILDHYGFPLIYLTGAFLIIPTIFIMMGYLSDFKDMHYEKTPFILSQKTLKEHPAIVQIYWVNFFLQVFYAWMIIYAPIYFHDHLNISYEDFGIILSIALTAFVIFPTFEGWLADKVLGEKEMLLLGFFLMSITSLAIPYLSHAGIGLWMWGALLFVGRMGAATVETMSEVYFFKHVDAHNASLVGYFRRARPLAFIIAPLLASVLLGFHLLKFGDLFYVLGFIMLFAFYFTLRLKDTL